MKDDYCVFVIVASLIALALPATADVVYTLMAAPIVWLAGVQGGWQSSGCPPRPHPSARSPRSR